MLETLNDLGLAVADPLLGWLLRFPRDLVLVGIAVGTALLLTLVRLWTTDQGFLAQCGRDKKRLKELIREAKAAGDRDEARRYRTTIQQIGGKLLRAEVKPLVVSFLPIVLLGVWAFARLAYLAPAPGEALTARVYFPPAAIGDLVHLVPQEGLDAPDGWIRRVGQDFAADGTTVVAGVAEWRLRAAPRSSAYPLTYRHGGRSIRQDLIADGFRYAPPVTSYGEGPGDVIEVRLAEYKPLGLVPGWSAAGVAPWLVGYLLLVLPLAFVLKPVLRIK